MALTIKSLKEAGVLRFVTQTEVTFGATYTAEGEAFTPANAGLSSIDHAWATLTHGDEAEESEMFICACWYESEKLHLLDAKTGKELATGKKTAKVKAQVFAVGKARAR